MFETKPFNHLQCEFCISCLLLYCLPSNKGKNAKTNFHVNIKHAAVQEASTTIPFSFPLKYL